DLLDSDTNSNAVKQQFAALEADAGIVTGEDPHVSPANGAIGYARSILPVVFANAFGLQTGADAPPANEQFSLHIFDTASGLTVTGGSQITLELYDNGTPDDTSDDLILGRVDGGEYDEQIAFAIAIDDEGRVSIAQYLSLEHP